jgi:hypothetical protein
MTLEEEVTWVAVFREDGGVEVPERPCLAPSPCWWRCTLVEIIVI